MCYTCLHKDDAMHTNDDAVSMMMLVLHNVHDFFHTYKDDAMLYNMVEFFHTYKDDAMLYIYGRFYITYYGRVL